jgi:hypothetical protein
MNPVLIPASKLINLSYNSDVRTNSLKMYGNLLMLGTIKPLINLKEYSTDVPYRAYHSHLLNEQDAATVLHHCYTSADLAKFVLNGLT